MGIVHYDSNHLSVRIVADRYEKGVLNLHPVFQRQSVWRTKQRVHLLDSILHGYPIPSLFLYRHVDEETGDTIFEVIDGKQRLESLLMYMGHMPGKFEASVQLPDWEKPQPVNWTRLRKLKQQSRVEEYLLHVIEVTAELSDIVELFVRINSTGNALTGQEVRNARFYRSAFLKTARRLATRYEPFLQSAGVIGARQVRRMKHIELMSEILYAAHIGGVGNKKRVLDTAMRADALVGRQLRLAEQLTIRALNRLRRMFPALSRTVRFHKVSDFYSLVVVIMDLERKGFILDNRKRNVLAWDLLVALSNGVDELSLRSRRLDFKSLSPREELFRQYLQSVREGSDSQPNRQKRHDLIHALLAPVFAKKDSNRLFSPEQRRILWNSAGERVCAECGCRLTWTNFQVDHIKPFSAGGKTRLENAALLCAKDNAAKGKRVKKAAA